MTVGAFVAGLLAALLITGCAHTAAHDVAPEPEEVEVQALRPPLTIYREELDERLQLGLQPLIAELSLRPAQEKGRFVGWRVQFLKPEENLYRLSAVRPGDVVQRVNGEPLERPDQMMKVWKSLDTAETITFSILRAGEPLEITYTIAL